MMDGHMHLEYGPLSIEYVLEFCNEAKKKGLSEIQILDHTHRFIEFEPMYEPLKKYPIQKEWLENKKMKFKNHLQEFIDLMEQVKQLDLPVKVTYGLEVCYTSKNEAFLKELLPKYKFDFLVGSVHSVDDILYDMSFSKELLFDKYDINYIYQRFYQEECNLIKSGLFTQIGHPDQIKLKQIYPTYDLTPTYQEMAKLLNKYNVLAENNTGIHYRYNHPDIGLSKEFLKVLKDNNVKMITASDAHKPSDVGTDIALIYEETMK